MYGAFLTSAENVYHNTGSNNDQKREKTFTVEIFPDLQSAYKSSVQYITTLQFTTYGSHDVEAKSGTTLIETKGPASCFEITTRIFSRVDDTDNFIFKSNGCPGISDPRILASKIFDILFKDMWPQDSTRAYVINLQGSSADSWFSDLIQHPAVDAALGFRSAPPNNAKARQVGP